MRIRYVVEKIVGHDFLKDVCAVGCCPPGVVDDALTAVIGYPPAASKMEGIRGSIRPDHGIRGKPTVRCSVSFVMHRPRLMVYEREGAKDVVEEYYSVQGGRPEKPAPAPKKRKSMGETKASPKAAEPKKQRKPSNPPGQADDKDSEHWVPSRGKNWENEVVMVETVMKDNKIGGLCGYVHWKNGRKSKVALEACKEKCPRKVSALQTQTVCQYSIMPLIRLSYVSFTSNICKFPCRALTTMHSNYLEAFSRIEAVIRHVSSYCNNNTNLHVLWHQHCWRRYINGALARTTSLALEFTALHMEEAENWSFIHMLLLWIILFFRSSVSGYSVHVFQRRISFSVIL